MADVKVFLLGIREFLHNKCYFRLDMSIDSLIKCKNNEYKFLLHCSIFALSGGLGAQTTITTHSVNHIFCILTIYNIIYFPFGFEGLGFGF